MDKEAIIPVAANPMLSNRNFILIIYLYNNQSIKQSINKLVCDTK